MASKDAVLDNILASALGIINRLGYGGLTLSELARQAKISKQRLYYHFPTPEDVVLVLAQQWSQTGRHYTIEALATTSETGAYKMLAVCDGTFRWMESYPELSRLGLVLYQSSPHTIKLKDFLDEARGIARKRVKEILLQETKFQEMTPAQIDKAVTAIHSLLYGFFFYIVMENDFDRLHIHEKNCRENMKRLIDSYLR